MRKISLCLLLFCAALLATAQNSGFKKFYFTEAASLTMVGKMMPTTNPYHRIDTMKYKGFLAKEVRQIQCPTGMAIAFKTNSTSIAIYTDYQYAFVDLPSTNGIAYRGYDLYIKKDGEWVYAASHTLSMYHLTDTLRLISNMNNEEKECLLYLPIFSEPNSIQIGVEKGATLSSLDNPFRHRICIFGSSFTHGVSTSRPGMNYPAQLSRMTGLQLLNLGCSGNCKLQSYFADVLVDVDADAFIFDAFSNPTIAQIKERLFPFIEKIQAAHPGKPLIFQHTIRREGRNFRVDEEEEEQARIDVADSMMAIAVKKYKDVYFIYPNASAPLHEASVDGTHPDDYGYTLWAESIRKPVLKILKKYGIR